MVMVWTYAIYLVVSVALTVWVGWTLHKNGRAFLKDALAGNEALADSLNHLLLVGFYLINLGFVTTALRFGTAAHDAQGAIEHLSTKIGIVLLVLGGMHFFNLLILSRWRQRTLRYQSIPEVLPVESRRTRMENGNSGRLHTFAVPLEEENPGHSGRR